MKYGRTLLDLASELERQMTTKRDMIVPTPLLHHETRADGSSRITVETPDGTRAFETTDNFRRQLAEKIGIPFKYFERMREDQPALLDQNIHTWLREEPEQRMVRTLDGRARAFLSDRYRRLDNYDLLQHVFPILETLPGARFESVELTDTKLFLKVVTPREFEMQPGDIVQAGIVVSNSETGHGTLSVQQLLFRLICRNGLIAPDSALRKTHVGRLSEASTEEVMLFQDDTLAADDTAFFLKVRDVVQAAVAEATFVTSCQKMQRTLGIKLTGDPAKAVETLGVRYLFNETERAGVLRRLIQGADLTGYGLVNAVTHFAQEVESYDRSTELEAVAGKMIDQSNAQWNAVATA